jgi:hypothetical protein
MGAAINAIRSSQDVIGIDSKNLLSAQYRGSYRKAFQGLQKFSTIAIRHFLRRKIKRSLLKAPSGLSVRQERKHPLHAKALSSQRRRR